MISLPDFQPRSIAKLIGNEGFTDRYTVEAPSRKRPPRKFEKVVATRAGRLREWALVSDQNYKTIEEGRLRELSANVSGICKFLLMTLR